MKYKIASCISQEQAKLLKGLEGSVLNRIFLDEVGDFALSVVIDSSNEKLIIKNCPTNELDGDEYPKLVIEKCEVQINGYREIIVGKAIKNILIVRDEATWSVNDSNWLVNSDIGVRVIIEDKEWLFIAHDSLAGLIKIIEFSGSMGDKNALFEDYWSMKTDILESLKREEISIY